MLETLLQWDREILLFLNALGSEQWDPFWLYITNQFNWWPLFAFLLVTFFAKFGWKNALVLLVFIAAMVTFSDQFTNFIKYTFERVRPCNEPTLVGLIRDFSYKPRGFSYYSGHASLSTTFTVFTILLLRPYTKLIYLMLLFPLVFGLSRIYLGVHYPFDILSGYVAGVFFGILFYKLQAKLRVTDRF